MKRPENRLTQIGKYVREVVKKERPETVERLVWLVQQKHDLPEQEIMDIVSHAGLRLTKRSARASDLKHYMITADARWYWFTVVLCMLTPTVVFILPEINPAVFFIRTLLGSVFALWIPGYCLVKSLFPGKQLGKITLVALGLGTSIMLVPMMAFVLHYTPWGIKTASVTVALAMLVLALSTLAILREHQELSNL